MAYEKDGRFWPTDVDRVPRVARFHVPSSSLTAENYDPTKRVIEITEPAEGIQKRLTDQFPFYRAAQFAAKILGINQGEYSE
jgi:hypothetical protein